MDTQQPQQSAQQPQVIQCQCHHGRRHGWGIIGSFFRFIGLIVLLALVFAAGLAIGGFGSAGMPFNHAFNIEKSGIAGPGMMLSGKTQGFRMQFDSEDRHFGVVTAISGQKITIADNGGGTQTVAVTADTIVLDGDKEVAVWTLRVGNAVRVIGGTKESVIIARLIEVIR
jgi:hypothetical protein